MAAIATPKAALPKGGPLARQAALACGNALFRTFLYKVKKQPAHGALTAAVAVRWLCGPEHPKTGRRLLDSRALLDHDPDAASRWRDLYGEYLVWKDALR